MRVLITVYPNSRAHLYPVAPLAWALIGAGHEVRIAGHAGAADLVMSTGLTPVFLGEAGSPSVRETSEANPPKSEEETDHYARVLGLNAAEREHWIVFYQMLSQPISDYLRLDRPEATDLVEFARAWKPDLVLWDPTHPAAAVAARACGAAHARLAHGQDIFAWSVERCTRYADQLRAAGLDENPLATMVRPLAQKYGIEVDQELLVGQWTIESVPEDLSMPTSTVKVRIRHIPYSGTEVFPKWLYSPGDRPRIAMSLGESTRRFIVGDWDRTPKIMKALDGLDIDVVATLNDLQLHDVDRVPDNVQPIEWVCLPHLLPTCQALIHHGGLGTYSAAVASKVPHLVCDLPNESLMMREVEDDVDVKEGTYQVGFEYGVDAEAVRVEKSTHWELPAKKVESTPIADYVISHGAGERIDHRAQSIDEIRETIYRVATSETYRIGASRLYHQWLATPTPAEIIPVLERLTAEYKDRGSVENFKQ